ncbi:hypothetical protein SETIT_9G368700v2 [Setaria italica]|uniref:MOB kinase activator-like 1A n=1 Tax=Setaria italica TaxID=4555 RepID=A0A368SPP7_SETIT|nr:hypothetical protein SETIT_9G368700v2 [Setaria italica]
MDRTCRTIQRTFKPKQSAPSGSKGLQLKRYIDTTLGQGDLGEAVRLPIGENLNEWLAVHTVDFFNSVIEHSVQHPDGGAPFPPNFRDIVKTILKRLFRVYAHIYHSHFQMIMNLEEVKHLNTYFKHFTFFTQEFQLIDRAELAPLNELIETIMHGR